MRFANISKKSLQANGSQAKGGAWKKARGVFPPKRCARAFRSLPRSFLRERRTTEAERPPRRRKDKQESRRKFPFRNRQYPIAQQETLKRHPTPFYCHERLNNLSPSPQNGRSARREGFPKAAARGVCQKSRTAALPLEHQQETKHGTTHKLEHHGDKHSPRPRQTSAVVPPDIPGICGAFAENLRSFPTREKHPEASGKTPETRPIPDEDTGKKSTRHHKNQIHKKHKNHEQKNKTSHCGDLTQKSGRLHHLQPAGHPLPGETEDRKRQPGGGVKTHLSTR